jgi:hypothetical protein
MTLSISGIVLAQPAETPARAPVATKQTPQPQPSVDTVTLSQSTQVVQLNQQGQSPSQIAEDLGIPVSTVNSDLGIVATTVASNPANAPVPADASAATAQPATAPAAPITRSASAA